MACRPLEIPPPPAPGCGSGIAEKDYRGHSVNAHPSSIATSACPRVSFGGSNSVSPSDRYEVVGAVAPQLMSCGSASLALQLVYVWPGEAGAGTGATGLVIQTWARIPLAVGRSAGSICSILLSRSISLGSDGAGTEVGHAATTGAGAAAAGASVGAVGDN